MLDLFTIFSKGGIVLWCFQGTSQLFTPSVNALIKSVILQERVGSTSSFTHESLALKYKLDNEFELVFVVAYQKILQLSYVDKFLDDIQKEFRDKYKDALNELKNGKLSRNFDFDEDFKNLLSVAEETARQRAVAPKKMRTFDQSSKSQRTVASMIENKKEEPKGKNKKKGGGNKENETSHVKMVAADTSNSAAKINEVHSNGSLSAEEIQKNLQKLAARNNKTTKKPKSDEGMTMSPGDGNVNGNKRKPKQGRKWNDGRTTNKDMASLDFSDAKEMNGDQETVENVEKDLVGQMHGDLADLDTESSSEDEVEETTAETKSNKKSGGFGFLSGLRNLVGSKTLTADDMSSVLEKMKTHIISKNVAADISQKLCDSVASKLEGRVLGTFNTVTSIVKQTLNESCMQILSPRRRVDILRDAMEAKQQRRPYVVTFCGVNGVGKSTNLAKICFWLLENGFRVLIAACDTFRAGAVEQLRTHCRRLNALHPPEEHDGVKMVDLYEKGYGQDAAGIAMQSINAAREMRFDVVLVDTAGRMQDNEPLMRSLAKLIKVNEPDLVLFVGEALVGNEAVDQLVKFNQALADHSSKENPHLIDGIVLTKFDTIDDKVGAAISMTYITGQPIVFVGTGQTYTDLKNLNAKAVVNALLKA